MVHKSLEGVCNSTQIKMHLGEFMQLPQNGKCHLLLSFAFNRNLPIHLCEVSNRDKLRTPHPFNQVFKSQDGVGSKFCYFIISLIFWKSTQKHIIPSFFGTITLWFHNSLCLFLMIPWDNILCTYSSTYSYRHCGICLQTSLHNPIRGCLYTVLN